MVPFFTKSQHLVAAQSIVSVISLDTQHDSLSIGHRRKQLGSIVRQKSGEFSFEALASGMEAAGIDPHLRAEQIAPEKFTDLANNLTQRE